MIGYDIQWIISLCPCFIRQMGVSRSGLPSFTDILNAIPFFGKDQIGKNIERTEVKQRCNLLILPSFNPTSYPGNQKCQFWVAKRITAKTLDILTDKVKGPIHRRNGITLSCPANTDAGLCAEFLCRDSCSATDMPTLLIAPENKNLLLWILGVGLSI